MRVYEPNTTYSVVSKKPRRKHSLAIKLLPIILVIFFGISGVSYLRPLPTPKVHVLSLTTTAQPTNIKWPNYGQAAIAEASGNQLAETINQKSAPTASVAKVILALAVLKKQPLAPNQLGQQITITKDDEAIYDQYFAKFGSVVPVKAGQKLYIYHVLEAVLMASANNLSDTLANHVFGSVKNYIKYANTLVADLGLMDTTVADASGFDPKTKATAHDLMLLGQAAYKNLVIAQITNQKSVTLPGLGKIDNRNLLVGQKGIVGIKTGNTEQAGGCYLFARQKSILGHKVTLVGSIMAAKNSEQAMADSLVLTDSIFGDFKQQRVVSSGQKVGYFELPWGGQVSILSKQEALSFGWAGKVTIGSVNIKNYATDQKAGNSVGEIVVNGQTKSQAVLSANIPQPSVAWRAFRWL